MTPLSVILFALGAAVLIGFSVVIGAPIFAIPIVLVVLAVIAAVRLRARTGPAGDVREMRERAGDGVEFTDRDRETLAG